MIPANRISAASKFFNEPLATPTNVNIQNKFLNAVPVGYYTNNTTDRVDYTVNDKNQAYAVFSRGERGQSTPYRGQTLPLPNADTRNVHEPTTIGQVKYTYIVTPTLLDYTFQDNVQRTRGKHAFTFGFQLTRMQANEKTDAYGSVATWNFSNNQTAGFSPTGTLLTTTGNAFASYLLGALNSSTLTQDSVVGTGGRYTDYSWWINDVFKVSTLLILNLGLRHDIWQPYEEVLDRQSFFNPPQPNPAAGGYAGILEFYNHFPDSCGCDNTVPTDWLNLGARVGVAYTFGRNSNWVVRAGYTMMYTHRGAVGGRVGARTGTGLVGFSATPTFTNPNGNNYDPAFSWDNGIPPYQQPPFFSATYGTEFDGVGK
jgi:hypothetical protein